MVEEMKTKQKRERKCPTCGRPMRLLFDLHTKTQCIICTAKQVKGQRGKDPTHAP